MPKRTSEIATTVERNRRRKWILAAAVVLPLIVLVLYVVSLRAPFAYDDRIHILENPVIRAFHSLFDVSAIRGAFTSPSGLAGRPLLMVTYGMNYALSGTDPASFRWINLALHAVNSL